MVMPLWFPGSLLFFSGWFHIWICGWGQSCTGTSMLLLAVPTGHMKECRFFVFNRWLPLWTKKISPIFTYSGRDRPACWCGRGQHSQEWVSGGSNKTQRLHRQQRKHTQQIKGWGTLHQTTRAAGGCWTLTATNTRNEINSWLMAPHNPRK